MEISKETRKALLSDLTDGELQAELENRKVPLSFFADGEGSKHVYVRKLERGGDTYHVIAGNGGVVWLKEDAVRGMVAGLEKLLEA